MSWQPFNCGLGGVYMLHPGKTRSVSAENPDGAPGAGAQAVPEGGAAAALGQGWKVRPCITVKTGETVTLADIPGPGVIQHIWITVTEAAYRDCVLRMYWDDAKEPAVESPLGDFFAAGFGERREIRSVPVQVEGGDGYNCYWPMPFHKRGVITATNEGVKNVRSFYYHIDYTEESSLPPQTAYFCAQYRNEFPEKLGRDYLILDAVGQGQLFFLVGGVEPQQRLGDARAELDVFHRQRLVVEVTVLRAQTGEGGSGHQTHSCTADSSHRHGTDDRPLDDGRVGVLASNLTQRASDLQEQIIGGVGELVISRGAQRLEVADVVGSCR